MLCLLITLVARPGALSPIRRPVHPRMHVHQREHMHVAGKIPALKHLLAVVCPSIARLDRLVPVRGVSV